MGNESKKKHILEKFFNFSKAFILHAKIPHPHTRTSENLLSQRHEPLPTTYLHWGQVQAGKPKLFCCKREILTHPEVFPENRKYKIRNGKPGNRTTQMQNVSNKRKWNENSWMANERKAKSNRKSIFRVLLVANSPSPWPHSLPLLDYSSSIYIPSSTFISISIRISISIPHSHRHWYLYSLCSR